MSDPWAAFPDAPTGKAKDAFADFPDAKPAKKTKQPPPKAAIIGGPLTPTGEAHDGDTFRLTNGSNARLYGADAFELDQEGRNGGQLVPLGQEARAALLPQILGGIVMPTGTQTYGRPVVTLASKGEDVGKSLVSSGMALPVPQYLASDPARQTDYIAAQREAIAAERGAYAGQYQMPSEYRHEGTAAPMHGKVQMTPAQYQEYSSLVRNPETTEAQLGEWLSGQGQKGINTANILSYMRRNPTAAVPDYFQQQDVMNEPVLKDGPDVAVRTLGALNEGIADTLGAPVDLVNSGLDLVGFPTSDAPWGGSESIRSIMHRLGIGQGDESFAPRSDVERYAQAFSRGIGQSAIPIGGMIAGGGRATLATAGALNEGTATSQAFNGMLSTAARNPGLTVAAETAAGGGAGLGGQAADDIAPGNPVAQIIGQTIGGIGGGGLAAMAQAARGARLAIPGGVPEPLVEQYARARPGQVMPEQATGNWSDFPDAPEVAAMASEAPASPFITSDVIGGIPRTVDRIDVNNRARPLLDPATEMQRIRQAEGVNPADVLPVPSNTVASMDEAAAIGSGMRPEIKPLNEMSELERRSIPSPVDGTRTIPKRGPLDMVTFLRTSGGIADEAGELRHMGIDNSGRDLDFAKGEQRFGKLVDPAGLRLDEAADLAYRNGYFPDHTERPTVAEFLDRLEGTHKGFNRSFRTDDLAEIDAFNSARDQRMAVERARNEGAPLVADRGEPVTMADMEANQPPVSAYEEWGENAPDFAGNIRLANLDSPQSIKRALVGAEQRTGGFDAARRGRITQAETEQLASELGMTPDDLLKRRKGQAFNAEEALAARQILAKSGNELVNMARSIQRLDDPGEEKLAAFRQAWVRHVAIQEQVAGATAEAGRALAQFRQMADSRMVRGNVLDALSQGGGGKDRLKAAADLILDNADTPQRLNKIAAQAMKPKWLDKVNELWINSLLSGPQTHVVNAVSNTMTALAQIPEHAVAAGVGSLRSLATRNGDADRVLFSELGARTVGLLQGTKEGLAQAWRTMKTGEGSDFANKVEARTQDAISGTKGKIIRFPTRALSSSDELFKAMARRMELNGLAVRQAAKEGLRGKQGIARAAELVANPSEDMLDKAFDYARYVTFQSPLGDGMQGISRGINSLPGMKFIVPFVRTPTNLLKFALERSPAAPVLKEWRTDFNAGGARRDLAVAKMMVGTGVGAAVMEMAANGSITGNGPADEGAAQLLRADGWQPYSIKVGDKYVSYSRLDPFATTLGVAAGMVELQQYMTEKQKDEVAMLVTASVMQNLSSKTWLSGMSGLIEALNDPTRFADNWWERLASSAAVPAGVAQVARTIDPTMREAEGVLDATRARIPGMSQDFEARRDIWGKPIVAEGGVGPDLVSPVRETTRKNDPITNTLLDAGVHLSKPQKKWHGRDLTPAEFGKFQERSGALAKDQIGTLIGGPVWAAADTEDRQDEVFKVLKKARKQAGTELFDGDSKPKDDPWAAFADAPKRRKRAPTIEWQDFPDAPAGQ